jgi:hypothetical protein
MGWMQSPPLFTAPAERVAYLANQQLRDQAPCVPHRLDVIGETPPLATPQPTLVAAGPEPRPLLQCPRTIGRPAPPVKSWDVYVDDFIGMVQGKPYHRQHVKRILFHSLDKVLRPLEDTDGPRHQKPASIKKMLKGDETWATWKTILRWTIDTIKMTMELPQHGIDRLFEWLDSITRDERCISVNKWKLRSTVLAIPGRPGLFSVLQEVLKKRCDKGHASDSRPLSTRSSSISVGSPRTWCAGP